MKFGGKKTLTNDLTKYIEESNGKVEPKNIIKAVFGTEKYASLLSVSLRSEVRPLIDLISKNIDIILDYAINDQPEKEEDKPNFPMISRNVTIALSSASNKLKTNFTSKSSEFVEESEIFQKRMLEFIDSDKATRDSSTHWGKIMCSYAATPKFMFFMDKIDEFIPKLISKCDYPGYRDLLIALATQGNDYIFKQISESIASNMRDYNNYLKDKDAEKSLNLLYERTFYLLKIFNSCYLEGGETLSLGNWESRYIIVENILNAIVLHDIEKEYDDKKSTNQPKSIVIDAAVDALCVINNVINKTFDDDDDKKEEDNEEGDTDDKKEDRELTFLEMSSKESDIPLSFRNKIKQLIIATGKAFYHRLGLYNIDEIKPETSLKDLYDDHKLSLIIRTFPIFWESGIIQLSPLLFHGFNKNGDKETDVIQSLTPSKVTKTITDKVCRWISILNENDQILFNNSIKSPKDMQIAEKKRSYRKLIKFIENSDLIQKLINHFPSDLQNKEHRVVAFLNPFVIILAQVLSTGYVKFKSGFNGTDATISKIPIRFNFDEIKSSESDGFFNVFPPTMETDEFSRFIYDIVIPISNEINKAASI